MNVHIRKRPSKNGEKIYLYLEVYKGYTTTSNGTIKANRVRSKLDYFLYAKPKNSNERVHNQETLRKTEVLKGRKLDDVLNNKNGFRNVSKSQTSFLEYFEKLTKERFESKGNYGNWDSVHKHLKKFLKSDVIINQIDIDLCKEFKEYLLVAKTKSGKNLSPNSISSYFNKFRASLNQAVDDGLIMSNPSRSISLPKSQQKKREFLTEDEIKSLIKPECRYDVLKRAFLFSCLTGLRWSDIQKLKWSHIQKEREQYKVVFHQEKTKGLQYHMIPESAVQFLGIEEKGEVQIFSGLKYSAYMNVALRQWIMRAGITKDITFHCARHTYATLLLTKGADIFTVSKLLGHSEIRTTQVYANIIDEKKNEAVQTLNIL